MDRSPAPTPAPGDRLAIAAYLGTELHLDHAMVEFAEAYADQNERDYEAFQQAVEDSRLVGRLGELRSGFRHHAAAV